MTRPKHSYRAQARKRSDILTNRAALMACRVHDAGLLSERRAREAAELRYHDKQRAAYIDIIQAYDARDPDDCSERWEIHDPKIIEFRRAFGLPPMGWHVKYRQPIYYPEGTDYADIYPLIPESEAYLKKYYEKPP